jgi:dTMP kinase
MNQKSLFISFEGGEGAGKSTQIRLLSDWLENQGVDHVLTREPGGCEGAELIRELVLKGSTDRWEPMTEALLITAARTEHVEKVIKPTLASGKWVLCDRFFDSTIAYQGAGHGLGMEKMRDLQVSSFGSIKPDITFLLDIPIVDGLARAQAREDTKAAQSDKEDRFERMGTPFHETLSLAFKTLAVQEPERFSVIDAGDSIENIQQQIRNVIDEVLG